MQFTVDILADSYSVIGDKSLTFSSDSDSIFSFKDTGGIFGAKKDLRITKNDFSRRSPFHALTWTETGDEKLVGRLNFDDGFAIYSTQHGDIVLRRLLSGAIQNSLSMLYLPAVTNSQTARRFTSYYQRLESFDNHVSPEQQSLFYIISKGVREGLFLPISLCSDKDTVTINRDKVKSGVWPVCSMMRQAASFC